MDSSLLIKFSYLYFKQKWHLLSIFFFLGHCQWLELPLTCILGSFLALLHIFPISSPHPHASQSSVTSLPPNSLNLHMHDYITHTHTHHTLFRGSVVKRPSLCWLPFKTCSGLVTSGIFPLTSRAVTVSPDQRDGGAWCLWGYSLTQRLGIIISELALRR